MEHSSHTGRLTGDKNSVGVKCQQDFELAVTFTQTLFQEHDTIKYYWEYCCAGNRSYTLSHCKL